MKLTSSHFVAPNGRFSHVQIDLVGPRPQSEGNKYLLTMVDRFSRWPEAVPLSNRGAPNVAGAFYGNWVSRFGALTYITSDQGPEFESQFFSALLSLIGCQRIRTTTYYPTSNGIVERWHRDLKAALSCHTNQWTKVLSTVPLGLRTRVRQDTSASSTDYMYGAALRVPGEFLLQEDFDENPRYFLEDFREYMRGVRPVPVAHHDKRKTFFFEGLLTFSNVFPSVLVTEEGLQKPYTGPNKVIAVIE